jgi:hypothetical protein
MDKYALRRKIIVYVKDEGSYFNAMTNALTFVVSCECFDLEEIFKGIVKLVMFFPRHANMVQQMKKYVEISNVSLLSLYK